MLGIRNHLPAAYGCSGGRRRAFCGIFWPWQDARDRPIGELLRGPWPAAAALAHCLEAAQDHPPFLIQQARGLDLLPWPDGYVQIGMDDSMPVFFGAALAAAPLAEAVHFCIELAGRKAVSTALYVGLTLQCLSDFRHQIPGSRGARDRDPVGADAWVPGWRTLEDAKPGCLRRLRVWPCEYKPGDYKVEGDWSQASYFLAAGALGKRLVYGARLAAGFVPFKGDRAILDILQKWAPQN